MAKKLLHRCIGAHARVCVYFLQRLCMHLNKCFDHHACAGVHVKQVLWHQCTHLRTCSLQGVHMRSCMCSLLIQRWGTRGASAYTFAYTLATGCAYALIYVQFVHSALGNESGGVQLVYEGTCCLAWGLMCDRRRDKGVVCLFSIFNSECMHTLRRKCTCTRACTLMQRCRNFFVMETIANLSWVLREHRAVYCLPYCCLDQTSRLSLFAQEICPNPR